MLSNQNRIKKKKDFDITFKNSKSFKNNFFIFKVAKNNLKINRFGFVISSKVSKKAVIRNKIKRRLSEIIKVEFKNTSLEKKANQGMDLVIIVLPGLENKNFSEIKENIKKLLIRASLIVEK